VHAWTPTSGNDWFTVNADVDSTCVLASLTPQNPSDLLHTTDMHRPAAVPFIQNFDPRRLTGVNIFDNNFDNNLASNVLGVNLNVPVQAADSGDIQDPELMSANPSASRATSASAVEHGVAPNTTKPTCLCGDPFSRMDSLRRHIQTRAHRAARAIPIPRGSITGAVKSGGQYHCIHCDRHPGGFKRRDSLRQHLRPGYHKLSKQTIDVYLQVRYGS
jgi:hypothetical protein